MSRAINYLLVSLTLSTILCTILLMSTYSRPSKERYNGRFWRAPIVDRINQVLTKAPEYYVVDEPIITENQHIQIDIVELNEGIIFLSPAKLDESDNIPLLNASPERIEFEKYQNENSIDPLQNKETSTESITDYETTTEDEMTTSESTSSFPDVETTNGERSNDHYVYHKTEDLGQANDDPCHGSDPGFFDVLWCLGHRAYKYVKSVISYWLGY